MAARGRQGLRERGTAVGIALAAAAMLIFALDAAAWGADPEPPSSPPAATTGPHPSTTGKAVAPSPIRAKPPLAIGQDCSAPALAVPPSDQATAPGRRDKIPPTCRKARAAENWYLEAILGEPHAAVGIDPTALPTNP